MDENSQTPTQPEPQEKFSNRIYVGEFTDQYAETFTERVLSIAAESPSKPIVVYINSDGGSVHALLAMQAVMDSVQNPIVTVATGRAFSAGADLLAHGDIRFVSPYARIMIHETSAGTAGHIDDLAVSMDEIKALNTQSMEILARDMGMTTEALKALFKARGRDIHVGAEQAVKLGLADHIGLPSVVEKPIVSVEYQILLQKVEKPSTLRTTAKRKKK